MYDASGGHVPRCVQVVYDLQRMTRTRRMPLPLHSVSEDGARGLAVNMQRLEAASPGMCLAKTMPF